MMTDEMKLPEIEMAIRLRKVCEAQDPTISSHLGNVARYACKLARLADLSEEQIRQIHYAAPLHDLGKIGLRRNLLEKPGALDPIEMKTIQSHTRIGYDILSGSPWPTIKCAASIALNHHENWDGSGYPNGRKGEAIPIQARLVAVADVYDALLSARAYKTAWSENQVIAELRRLGGTKFEPTLIDLFLDNLPKRDIHAA
jgi:putative two-component system response regulator